VKIRSLLEVRHTAVSCLKKAYQTINTTDRDILEIFAVRLGTTYEQWMPVLREQVVYVTFPDGTPRVTRLEVVDLRERFVIFGEERRTSWRLRLDLDHPFAGEDDEPVLEMVVPVAVYNAKVRHWLDLPVVTL
jgi:hypothetical protein